MAKKAKVKIEKTPWCSAKKVLRQLERLEIDIKSNGGEPEKRKRKLEYLEALSSFIKFINVSRSENVKFRFSGNTKAMCKCMMEINLIFDETSIQVENCNLIPDECRDKICVLKIEGQTFVLIELE